MGNENSYTGVGKMNLCNYSMNVSLLGVAREMKVAIEKILVAFDEEGKFYRYFRIVIGYSPWTSWTSTGQAYFALIPTKDEVFTGKMFASDIDFNVKIENIEHHFYILRYPSKIQLYFNLK